MSVFVKGMEMPEKCFLCRFFEEDPYIGVYECVAKQKTFPSGVKDNWRPDWCPLEEFHLIEFRGFTEAGLENVVVGLDSMASANRFDDLLRRRVKKAAEKICDEIMENVKKEMQEEVKKAREIEDGR